MCDGTSVGKLSLGEAFMDDGGDNLIRLSETLTKFIFITIEHPWPELLYIDDDLCRSHLCAYQVWYHTLGHL